MTPTNFHAVLAEQMPPDSPLGGPYSPHSRARGVALPTAGGEPTGVSGGIVDPAEVTRVMRKLGVSPTDPEAMFQVADHMGIDPDDEESMQAIEAALSNPANGPVNADDDFGGEAGGSDRGFDRNI